MGANPRKRGERYRIDVEGARLVAYFQKPDSLDVSEPYPMSTSVVAEGVQMGCLTLTHEAIHAINVLWENSLESSAVKMKQSPRKIL